LRQGLADPARERSDPVDWLKQWCAGVLLMRHPPMGWQNTFLWWIANDTQLSQHARQVMESVSPSPAGVNAPFGLFPAPVWAGLVVPCVTLPDSVS